MIRKFNLFFFSIIIMLTLVHTNVWANNESSNQSIDELYEQQLKNSQADELFDELPNETKKSLDIIGINKIDWKQLSNITPEKIFSRIVTYAKESSPKPIKAALGTIAIILLAALMDSFKLSISQRPLNGATNVIATLCVCLMALEPILSFIGHASNVIKGATNFMLCYIPVMTGVMIASGQTVSAASYNLLMAMSCEFISQIASTLITPLLSIFLAIAVISSISPSISLGGICNIFNSFIKWSLNFVMTVFVGILAIQSIVGNAADTTTLKAAKFMLSSFVPIVGGAIGDAFGTVQSCVKLLKSGIGTFGIIAASFIFLPVLIECIVWIAVMNTCCAVSEMFDLKNVSSLLKSACKVTSTMLSILLSSMTILTVSTVIVLITGGGSS